MSVRRLDPNQPDSFEFTPENLAWSKELIGNYPDGKQQSAVIPLLWRAQEQNDGWVSRTDAAGRWRHAWHGLYPNARDRDLLHNVPIVAELEKKPISKCAARRRVCCADRKN